MSAIAFMSVNGMLDLKVVSGNVNGDIYTDFVEEILLPHLMPFDGRNPHSVVILDNCAFHLCEDDSGSGGNCAFPPPIFT